MDPLPMQCAARYREIQRRAGYLIEMYVNGNKKDTLQNLEDMPAKEAFAVLARMMEIAMPETQRSLSSFLAESA